MFRDAMLANMTCHLGSFHGTNEHIILYLRYHNALKEQPPSDLIDPAIAKPLAAVLFVVGQTFVLTSTWALGITGKSDSVYARMRFLNYIEQVLSWVITLVSSCPRASLVSPSTSSRTRCTSEAPCALPLRPCGTLPRLGYFSPCSCTSSTPSRCVTKGKFCMLCRNPLY